MPVVRYSSVETYIILVTAVGGYGHCLHKGLQCVNLPQCPLIGRQVHHSSHLLLAMAKLNVYICGLKRGTVQVCCPKHSLIHPTSKPRVTGMQPDTSLVRHRNFNLINRNCGVGLTDRISGGQNASPGEFPWLAILLYNGKHIHVSPDISSYGELLTRRRGQTVPVKSHAALLSRYCVWLKKILVSYFSYRWIKFTLLANVRFPNVFRPKLHLIP